MYERILVPLDGSQVAEVALDHAVEIARAANSRLVLFQALTLPSLTSVLTSGTLNAEAEAAPFRLDMQGFELDRNEADQYLTNVCSTLVGEGIGVSIATAQGDPAGAIVSYAKAADISLIVMSTHGSGGLSRPAFGSVAEQVVRNSPIPVLVIPHR